MRPVCCGFVELAHPALVVVLDQVPVLKRVAPVTLLALHRPLRSVPAVGDASALRVRYPRRAPSRIVLYPELRYGIAVVRDPRYPVVLVVGVLYLSAVPLLISFMTITPSRLFAN